MSYEGMAFVKLYKNKACTKELEIDADGKYILNINKISTNAYNPYIFNIYSKNVGSHKAYDYNVVKISSTLTPSITQIYTELMPNQIDTIRFTVNIPQGNSTHNIVLKVNYDNV